MISDGFITPLESDRLASVWADLRYYSDILGNAALSDADSKGERLLRSIVKVSQAVMADQPDLLEKAQKNNGLEEMPELADRFRPDPGIGTLFALPTEEGGVVITTNGSGQVIHFRPDGSRLYTLELGLARHNNAFYLCHSPLQGGVTLLLDQYYHILDIDRDGVIKSDSPMPMPFITSIHFDSQKERFHVCSAESGICAIYDPLWKRQSLYEKWPLPSGRMTPLRLFYDSYQENFWVVLGFQGSVYPLSLLSYDRNGRWNGQIIHLPIAGTNAVTCRDSLGRFHVCCKRTKPAMFDALGRPLYGTPLPLCRSLQTRDDTLFAIGRLEMKLKIFSVKEA